MHGAYRGVEWGWRNESRVALATPQYRDYTKRGDCNSTFAFMFALSVAYSTAVKSIARAFRA
jgi:hypothetical protein